MPPLSRAIFILAHELMSPGFYSMYRGLLQNQWKPPAHLQKAQDMSLRRMIRYCYERIPFYKRHLDKANVEPSQIHGFEDLERIPPITKEDIRRNKESFWPQEHSPSYYIRNTGGTTGTPLRYKISRRERFLGASILYRGWSAGGYRLGDPILFLAGSSLLPNVESRVMKRLNEISRNTKFLSAFSMDDEQLECYADVLQSWKPRFLRGYPSALSEFVDFLEEGGFDNPPIKAIFTTSEKLFPKVRGKLGSFFEARVFDGYGANDGGISTFECEEGHIHIDMERSILEVVDKDNHQIEEGEGEVLATSLHNYAMPFIRYKIGDRAVITSEMCSCGRGLPLLQEIIGRSVSIFVTPDGSTVHGWFFLYIFWEIGEEVARYRVTQKTREDVSIQVVPGPSFSPSTTKRISKLVKSKCADWTVDIQVVDSIPESPSGKRIFVESEVI